MRANKLARKPPEVDGKLFGMEPRSIGGIVKAWRMARGMSVRELAEAVGTSRQNVENLEKGEADRPRYLYELARLMGYTADELVQLRDPPPPGQQSLNLTPAERALVLAFRQQSAAQPADTPAPAPTKPTAPAEPTTASGLSLDFAAKRLTAPPPAPNVRYVRGAKVIENDDPQPPKSQLVLGGIEEVLLKKKRPSKKKAGDS